MVTALDLLPGHRLRIELASSNFPNYERNLKTGGHNFDEHMAQIARTRVLHDPDHVSYLEFAVFAH
jgi:predicted acyl esterase